MFGPVHPELLPAIEGLQRVPLSAEILPMVRADRRAAYQPSPDLPGARFEERMIPGPDGAPDLRVLIYRPETANHTMPGVLHFHGGGLIIGVPEMSHARNGRWAADLGCVVVSVEYRKAPEDPFPAAPLDCIATWDWMQDNAAELGIDPARIALAGESAGGCLAATVAMMLRDRGTGPQPVFQVLIFPMLDDRTGADTSEADDKHLIWTARSNRLGWSSYLGQAPAQPQVPRHAVPAREDDLSGLPRAWIGVGTIDIFAPEDIAFAARLLDAGVSCELHVEPGLYHGFPLFAPDVPVARAFEASYTNALAAALNG